MARLVILGSIVGVAVLTVRPMAPARRPIHGSGELARLDGTVSDGTRSATAIALASVASLVIAGPVAMAFPALAFCLVRHAATTRRRAIERQRIADAVPELMELFVLLLGVGASSRQIVSELAVHGPEPTRDALSQAVARIERGSPTADVLADLPDSLGPTFRPVADLVVSAERDGQPLGPALTQLAVEARAARQRLAEADARRLPVRLAFPLVACTLPSFVLVAIAPAVLGALSSLGTIP